MKKYKKNTKFFFFILFWSVIFVITYILFLPIKGDEFSHYPAIFGYILSTLLIVLVIGFFNEKFRGSYLKKLTIFILLMTVLFSVLSYIVNTREHFVINAAIYNYPNVLYFFLDTTNKEEVEKAIFLAKEGENNKIVIKLTEMQKKKNER